MLFLIFYLFFAGAVSAGCIYSNDNSEGLPFLNVILAYLTGWVYFPFFLGVLLYNLIEVLKQDTNDNKKGDIE